MGLNSWFVVKFEWRYICVLAVVLPLFLCGQISQAARTPSPTSPCKPAAQLLNTPQCLNAVRQLMADEDRYWFGSNYSRTCPPQSYSSVCINSDPTHLSILTRLRQDNDSSVDVIQQVLNVTVDAPAGSYEACGNTFPVEAVTHTIDPTCTTTIPLWSANHQPHVSWRSEVDKLYTLIVWDAGAFVLHGVMYNIIGSNLDHAQTAWNYRGPKNPFPRDQPYVFLLYEQKAEIQDSFIMDILIASLSQGYYDISPIGITGALSLTGPVGVSVLTVLTDPFAAAFMKKNRIINTCPALLTPKFAALPLSYNVSSAVLMSSVDVSFTTPDISFRSCCSDVTVASSSRMVNSLGDGLIQPVYTRLQPHVALVPSNFFNTFYFLRAKLTLLMLDVTEELARSSQPHTSLHWQVINIREGDVMAGETIQPYKAPLPLTEGDRRVILFLLLRQSVMVNKSDLSQFTGGDSCSPPDMKDRCGFNMTAFITEQDMTIEGASWFMTSPDAYSRHQAVMQSLQSEGEACHDVSGYDNPCPTCTSRSEVKRASFAGVGLTLVLLLLTVSRAVF